MSKDGTGFKVLIDKRTAELFDRFFDEKSIERHEFLEKLEMIRDSVSMGLKRETTETDEHETFVGSGAE